MKMPSPSPPWSTHDARVETLSRRMRKVSVQLHQEAVIDVLEHLLRDENRSNSVRYDIIKVVELRALGSRSCFNCRGKGQHKCRNMF